MKSPKNLGRWVERGNRNPNFLSVGGEKWGMGGEVVESGERIAIPPAADRLRGTMSFFKGRETYSVDDKGRVAIPAKMRKSMSPEANDTFVATRGPDDDPCIYAYPVDEWQKMEEQLSGLNQYNDRDRFFVRTLLYWADELTLDKQYRIMIPKALMEFARIDRNALIIGAMDHIEIWNPEVFESYLSKRNESYSQVAEAVMGMVSL